MLTREEFLALLARLRGDGDALTPDEVRAMAAYVAAEETDREGATDDELAEVIDLLRALGADDATALDVLEAAVDAVAAIGVEQTARADADAEVEQRREDLRRQLAGETAEDDTPPADEEPPAEAAPDAETPPAEGDAGGEGGDAGEGAEGRVPAAATAAAPTAPARPVTRAAGRAHGRTAGALVTRRTRQHNQIIRDGGGEFAGIRELGMAMLERRESFLSTAHGVEENVKLASIVAEYPDERKLDGMNASLNAATLGRLVDELTGITGTELEAAVASGGFCAPVQPYYGIPQIAEADQPMKASLVGFQATRGGITFRQPPDFSAFRGAVAQWTRTNDTTPGSNGPATKPCLVVPCLGTQTAYLYAVTDCLQFGNFMAMADPETVDNATKNTLAAFASKSETLILDQIKAASTLVDGGQVLGAFRDLLYHWGVAATGYRNRRRMRSDAVLELRAPSWVRDMIREDIARGLNAYVDQFAMADDIINRALMVRNLRAYWYVDGPTVDGVGNNKSQVFGPQNAGALIDFPDEVQWQMSPPGTFVFMENGRLDLGVVRDSTLNATNDYRTFYETFEGVAQLGFQSLWGTSVVCANGASAGTTSPDSICTTNGEYIPTGSGIGGFVAP